MEARNTQTRTPEAAARLLSNEKSGSEINSDEIPMDVNADPNGVDGDATKDSRTEEASGIFIGGVTAMEEEVFFITGSSYKGSWDALGMAGVGRYVMPNGTVYEGEIRDGMFHGHGSLYWSEKGRLDVVHLRGALQEHRYTFADGLAYRDADWSYCRFPDRRFYECTKRGLRPGGRALKTAKQPTKLLPSGCYDAGDGVFDPEKLTVTSYDDSTKVLRTPSMQECDWIVKNCRKSWSEPTGYRSSLNENWSENPPDLPYSLAASEESPDRWWKRLTTFARDFVDDGKAKDVCSSNEHLELPELCLCGQYVILGEPCRCPPTCLHSENEWQADLDGRRFYTEESSQYLDCNRVGSGDVFAESDRVSSADKLSEDAIDERKFEGDECLHNIVLETDSSADFSIRNSKEFRENLAPEKFIDDYRDLGEKSENGHHPSSIHESRWMNAEQLDFTVSSARSQDVLWPSREHSPAAIAQSVVGQRKLQIDPEEKLTVMIARREEEIDKEKITNKSNTMEKQEHENATSKNLVDEKVLSTSTQKMDKALNSQTAFVADVAIERNADAQNYKEKKSQEVASERSPSNNDIDKNHENQLGARGDVVDGQNTAEKSSKEMCEIIVNHRETPLENHDYATAATIPREKVPGATEPETTNGRRTETELLPKPTETGSTEESSERDLHFYRADDEAITSGDEVVARTEKFSRDKMKDDPEDNNLPSTPSIRDVIDKTKNELKKEVYIEEGFAGPLEDICSEKAFGTQLSEDNNAIYKEELKTSIQWKSKKSSEVSDTPDHASQDLITEGARVLITEEADPFPSKLNEETRKETLSTANSKVRTPEKSFTSIKDIPESFEKVHQPLANLTLTKQKPSKEKEIIEIYKKFLTEEKPRNKCSNANVWRLSSALRNYNLQTNPPYHSCKLQRKTNVIMTT